MSICSFEISRIVNSYKLTSTSKYFFIYFKWKIFGISISRKQKISIGLILHCDVDFFM